MTKKKSAKRALLMSALALLLCVSMLVGSTFAWFTDSVTSGRNKIVAGNLDVVLEYKTPNSTDWAVVTSDTVLFSEDSLWEPGHTEVVALRIRNAGTLALKYDLATTVFEEVAGTNVNGDTFLLSDYLKVGHSAVQQDGVVGDMFMDMFLESRNNAASLANSGFGESIDNPNPVLLPGGAHVCALAITMPTTVGNEANYKTGTDAPYISFGVTLLATQAAVESDSFDNQYDAEATFPTIIYTADKLAEIFSSVDNTYALTSDAILKDIVFYSDVTATEPVTVNGNGKTITMDASSETVFNWIGGTIPTFSNLFSSANGSKITVNDLTLTGTMQAVMAGHYKNATYNNYNTEFNNVNIVNAEVVSFSANISPALCVYGTLVMNNCNVYGTTLSPLDTAPMWPVYDMAVVNYSNTTINGGKIGSIFTWAQAQLTIDGAEVDTILTATGTNKGMITIKDGSAVGSIVANNSQRIALTIEAGAEVGMIDLSSVTDKSKCNITIADGATVGSIVANGTTYASIADWLSA